MVKRMDLMDISPKKVYPPNASDQQQDEIDDNWDFMGEVGEILRSSMIFGFEDEYIRNHLFIALHIYGNPTIIGYFPSRMINQEIVIQNENTNRFFVLDCEKALVGSMDRTLTFPKEPQLILKKKALSYEYMVLKGPNNKSKFIVLITQEDFPGNRTVIKIN